MQAHAPCTDVAATPDLAGTQPRGGCWLRMDALHPPVPEQNEKTAAAFSAAHNPHNVCWALCLTTRGQHLLVGRLLQPTLLPD